ncbi:MAG: SAM-dependent methyltransferase [Clostridia bacterium]|nr:SAM-dependent methyltransferase [Clostridia bacterium]
MPIRLDERLSLIANLVDYGEVADVGCDHGKLSYFLVSTDRASKAIATDISAPSLKKARELALENGVTDVLSTRLGDGLSPVSSREVDTVIIAGLGGDVISSILAGAREEGKEFAHFLLSPNTHPEKVRAEIVKSGHRIVYDDILTCAGKTYTVIKTEEGKESLSDDEIKYGKFFKSNENFKRQLEREIQNKKNILHKNFSEELKAKVEDLERLLAGLENYENKTNN